MTDPTWFERRLEENLKDPEFAEAYWKERHAMERECDMCGGERFVTLNDGWDIRHGHWTVDVPCPDCNASTEEEMTYVGRDDVSDAGRGGDVGGDGR